MTDHCDVIAAFVDNESVLADELAAALAAPDAREYLIDLLVLRGLVSETTRSEGSKAGPLDHSRSVGRGRWLVAAAAVLAVGVTTGFFAGRGSLDRLADVPPSPGPGVMSSGASGSSAPAPTHVIRMETGVDWTERSGGN